MLTSRKEFDLEAVMNHISFTLSPRKLALIRQRPISRPVQDPPSAAASTAEKTPMVIRHRML